MRSLGPVLAITFVRHGCDEGAASRRMSNLLASPISAVRPCLTPAIRGPMTPLVNLLVGPQRPPVIALATTPPHRDSPTRDARLRQDMALSATERAALGDFEAHEPCPGPSPLAESSVVRSPKR